MFLFIEITSEIFFLDRPPFLQFFLAGWHWKPSKFFAVLIGPNGGGYSSEAGKATALLSWTRI